MKKILLYLFSNDSSGNKNYPGMFDVLKGYAIITILLSHTLSQSQFNHYNPLIFVLDLLGLGNLLIPILFIINGYGFKITTPQKCIKKLSRYILIPYIITALFTTVVHYIAYYSTWKDNHNAIKESIKIALGFCLGLSETWTIHNITIFNIGACWFIIALFIASIVLNFLYNHFSLKSVTIICIVTALIGMFLGRYFTFFFSFSPALVGMFFIHIGHLVKVKNLLSLRPSYITYILYAIIFVITSQFPNSVAHGVWSFYITSLLSFTFVSIITIKLFLSLNRFMNVITNLIRFIGRYSLWILCIHSCEYLSLGVPWQLFVAKYQEHRILGIALMFSIRIVIVFSVLFIIINIKKHYSKHNIKKRKSIAVSR